MRKSDRKTIDVILCCYNQEKYIAQAVESIIMQKVDAQVRVIVADDCSTDKTLEIIQSYEKKSPFPFVYLKDDHNIGLSANYRRAFATCSAEYVAILEGDDWWSEDWHLSQLLSFLVHHRRYTMAFNHITRYYQDTQRYKITKWPFGKIGHVTIRLWHQLAWGNQIGNLSACMFRTKELHSLPDGFYNLKFADWDLGIMMALHGPIGLVTGRSSVYRVNENGQWSRMSNGNKNLSQEETLESIRPFLPKYCDVFIQRYRKRSLSGETFPFPMPLKYRIKSLFRRN